MSFSAKGVSKKITNLTLAFALVISSLAAVGPFIFSEKASAMPGSQVVYDALPAVSPLTNYPSLGYQATSTDEFGDYIELGGENRVLDDVTVTLSSWARWSDRATWDVSTYDEANSATFSHPITLNIYANTLTGGVPNTLLATSTQTFEIPYRPDGFAFNGIAHNITFDLSGLNTTLPSEVIVGIEYNTQTHGDSPLGITGPYNSLNVATPTSQPVLAGQDVDTDSFFWDTSHAGFYTDGGVAGTDTFREDTNWSPYVLALRISATSIPGPTLLFPQNNTIINTDSFNFDWEDVSGAVSYEFQNSNISNDVNANGGLTNVYFQGTSSTSQLPSSGAGEVNRWWQVRAVFGDSSKSEWSEVWKMGIDMTKPTTPTIEAPTSNLYLTTAPILNKWSASTDTNGINKYQVEYIYDDGHTFSGWPYREESGSTTQRNHSPSISEQGGVTIRVRAMDNAGNFSNWSNPVHYFYDATAPTSMNDLESIISGTVVVTQNIDDNVNPRSGKLRIWKLVGGVQDNSKFYASAELPVDASGNIVYTLNTLTQLFGDGEYVAKFTSWDKADHVIISQKNFTVDNTAPTVTINDIALNATTITGTVTEPNLDRVEVTVGGVTANATVTGSDWSITTPSLGDGVYTVSVRGIDQAGNTTDPIVTDELKIDTVAPLVSITQPLVTLINDATPTITGTYSDEDLNNDTTIILFIDGGTTGVAVTKNLDGTWTYTPTTALAEGTHSFVATASDAVDNDNSDTLSLTIDTVNPSLTVNPGTVGGDVATITGTAEVGAILSATFNGVTTAIANVNGTWSFTSGALENGTYAFSITATDEAGNGTIATTSVLVAVPVITITPAIVSPVTTDGVLGATTDATDETTTNNEGESDVEGATTDDVAAIDTDATDGSILGLAWYWWLLILAAIAAIASWIVAAVRRRNNSEA